MKKQTDRKKRAPRVTLALILTLTLIACMIPGSVFAGMETWQVKLGDNENLPITEVGYPVPELKDGVNAYKLYIRFDTEEKNARLNTGFFHIWAGDGKQYCNSLLGVILGTKDSTYGNSYTYMQRVVPNGTASYKGYIESTKKGEEKSAYAQWRAASTAKGNERVKGSTRYDTSRNMATKFMKTAKKSKLDNIIVAYGGNYADALSGSYLSIVKDAPIILTDKNQDKATLSYIKKNVNKKGVVYLIGGTKVVSSSLEKSLKSAGYYVKRLGGKTRYDTNLKILKEGGVNTDLLICSGTNFADALSVSSLGTPIMLVGSSLTSAQKSFLKSCDTLTSDEMEDWCYVIGGKSAVSEKVRKQIGIPAKNRVAGQTRYDTSVEVAKKFFGTKVNPTFDTVTITTGENYPDGICGGLLASEYNAPVLLVKSGATNSASKFVSSNKIKNSITFGGTKAVSKKVVDAVM